MDLEVKRQKNSGLNYHCSHDQVGILSFSSPQLWAGGPTLTRALSKVLLNYMTVMSIFRPDYNKTKHCIFCFVFKLFRHKWTVLASDIGLTICWEWTSLTHSSYEFQTLYLKEIQKKSSSPRLHINQIKINQTEGQTRKNIQFCFKVKTVVVVITFKWKKGCLSEVTMKCGISWTTETLQTSSSQLLDLIPFFMDRRKNVKIKY
jgi:hypothetical protein